MLTAIFSGNEKPGGMIVVCSSNPFRDDWILTNAIDSNSARDYL